MFERCKTSGKLIQLVSNCHILATMFLEGWKRRQVEIAYNWDLLGFEDEEVGCICSFSCCK